MLSFIRNNFFSVVFSISILLITIILFWSSNKGFDLSDEGYYITGYNSLIEKKISIHGFQFFTQNTFSKFGGGLIYFRILRLFLTIISCFILSKAIIKWLSNSTSINFSKKNNIAFSLLSILAGFTSYFAGPQTLSYNHLTLIIGNLLLSIIFISFSDSQTLKKTILLNFYAGILIGFEFFIKSPISVIFLALYLISLLYIFKTKLFSLFKIIIVVLVAIATSIVFVCYPISPIDFINDYMYELTVVSKAAAHGVNDLLNIYFDGLHVFFNSHLKQHLYTYIILIASLFFVIQKKYTKIQELAFIIFIGVLFSLLYSYYTDGYFISGHKNIDKTSVLLIIILSFSILIFATIYTLTNKKIVQIIFSKSFFLLSSLLVFPILCSLGTNNYLHIQIIFHINTLILLAFIGFEYLKSYSQKINIIFKIFFSIITIKIVMGVYYAIVIEPYRINGNLFSQTEPEFISTTNETIYIDKELKYNLTVISKIINIEKPNFIYSSSELFGLAYLFNKKSPGYGGFDCNVKESNTFICDAFNNSKLKNGKILFTIGNNENNCDSFPCFKTNGFNKKILSIKRNVNSIDSLHFYTISY